MRTGTRALACLFSVAALAVVSPSAAQTPSKAAPALASGALSATPALPGKTSSQLAAQLSAQTSAPGVTQALKDLKLSMTVAGRVEGLFVKEGDRVSAGQLLMHLDRNAEDLEVKRRRLLLQDTARLQELGGKEKTLTEQVASLKPLLATGGVSRKQVEDEEMALNAIGSERKTLEAAKRREQVELDIALEAYERRHLRAPIDGVITKVVMRVGESIAPHEATIGLVNISRVRFMGTISAQAGARLKVGNTVSIKLGVDDSAKTRAARVVFVSPVTDAASGLVEVIAEFDNADGSVRPGITGRMGF
jgi:RND family efflux transporter MFP subunit